MRHFPGAKQYAKNNQNQREQHGTDYFSQTPPDFLNTPLAPFVEVDHARHHGLPMAAAECGDPAAANWKLPQLLPWRGHRSGLGSVCRKTHHRPRQNRRGAGKVRLKFEALSDALARRWACKEGGVPVTKNGANFKQHRGRSADLDQEKRGHHDQQRHDRMNRDAQGAMFGVCADGMHVRHLNHGQKRQQDQAHDSRNPKRGWS